MNWYLLQTKPNYHILAQKHLSRQGFDVFLPLIVKTSRNRGKFVNNLKPLFPGYLFLGTKIDKVPWKSINATRGVSKAVTLDGQYRAISNKIISSIKCRCDQNDVLKKMDNIEVDDRVKIESGPFADFVCKVDKIADRERAWVLIEFIQQNMRTEIALNNLSKID